MIQPSSPNSLNFTWIIPNKLAGCAMPKNISHLQEIFNNGIRCVVSLQEMPDSLGDLFEKACLEWIRFPIEDFHVPADKTRFDELIHKIIDHLNDNIPVCVHCKAGIGRTGMVLTCVVGKYYTMDTKTAIALVRNHQEAIETDEQLQFVMDYLG